MFTLCIYIYIQTLKVTLINYEKSFQTVQTFHCSETNSFLPRVFVFVPKHFFLLWLFPPVAPNNRKLVGFLEDVFASRWRRKESRSLRPGSEHLHGAQ